MKWPWSHNLGLRWQHLPQLATLWVITLPAVIEMVVLGVNNNRLSHRGPTTDHMASGWHTAMDFIAQCTHIFICRAHTISLHTHCLCLFDFQCRIRNPQSISNKSKSIFHTTESLCHCHSSKNNAIQQMRHIHSTSWWWCLATTILLLVLHSTQLTTYELESQKIN